MGIEVTVKNPNAFERVVACLNRRWSYAGRYTEHERRFSMSWICRNPRVRHGLLSNAHADTDRGSHRKPTQHQVDVLSAFGHGTGLCRGAKKQAFGNKEGNGAH